MQKNLSLRITAEFDAGVEWVWQIWVDPRQLERCFGPPTWQNHVEQFDFEPGAQASYFMTGPEGAKTPGWWEFTPISAPNHLQLDDGFADDNGDRVANMGTAKMTVPLEVLDGHTRMSVETKCESEEQIPKMIQRGMEEDMREAVDHIDAILAE